MRHGREQFAKLRLIGRRAANLLVKHALASCGLQLGELAGEVLGDSRNAGARCEPTGPLQHAPRSKVKGAGNGESVDDSVKTGQVRFYHLGQFFL